MGENHLLQYVSIFFQIRNSFYNGFVLVQSFTSTQAATCRELQLSLSFSSLSWKGATTPIVLVLADPFTSTQAATCYNAPKFSTATGRELPPP